MIANITNFFKQSFLHEYTRWVVWLPVLLSVGIVTYFALPFEPSRGDAIYIVSGTALLTAWRWRLLHWRYFFLAFFIIAVGFSAAKLRAEMVKAPVIQQETKVVVSGNIDEILSLIHI